MPTQEQQQGLDTFGMQIGQTMRERFGHRWTLSILLSAMTNVIGAILENNKLTYDELFDRIDNAVKTWKLAYASADKPEKKAKSKLH